MANLTHRQYDQLERAIVDGSRIAIYRRGTEYVLIPLRIGLRDGRETIEARNPVTGDTMTLVLDEIDSLEFVR